MAYSSNYENWQQEHNKDQLDYYHQQEFRDSYTKEMVRKALGCYRCIASEVKGLFHCLGARMMNQNWPRLPVPQLSLRVLSLGSGPGTDLLAAVRAFADASAGAPLEIICTGVDLASWDMKPFETEVNQLMAMCESNIAVHWTMYKGDCADYVEYCIEHGMQFDLVISSYARAVDKIELLGQAVPKILSLGGRIFVIDNCSPKLTNGLKEHGFYVSQPSYDRRPIFLVKIRSIECIKNVFNVPPNAVYKYMYKPNINHA